MSLSSNRQAIFFSSQASNSGNLVRVLGRIQYLSLTGLFVYSIGHARGGEEFLIISHALDQMQMVQLAEKLRTLLTTQSIKPVGPVTASFGVTV